MTIQSNLIHKYFLTLLLFSFYNPLMAYKVKKVHSFLWSMLLTFLLMSIQGFAQGLTTVPKSLTIRLDLDPVSPAGSLWLRLTAENNGKEPVTVLRLRRHMLDYCGSWGGWTLIVGRQQGEMHPAYEGVVQPPTTYDIIELLPGESCAVRMNIGTWIQTDGKSNKYDPLINIPGEYTIQAKYTAQTFPYLHIDSELEAAKNRPLTKIEGLCSNLIQVRVIENAVEPQIATLKDEDYNVRSRAVKALGQIGAPAVQPLIAALKDEDPYVRMHAAQALGLIRDTQAVDPLIAALKDKDPRVQWNAAQALGEIKDTRAIVPLITALKDEKESTIRLHAARALGEIKDLRAIESLVTALRDKNSDVRISVAKALGKIGTPAVMPLIAALKNGDSFVRFHAAQALGEITDTRAINPLIVTMKDENPDVRFSAVRALSQIGGPAVDSLIAALKDEDANIRRNAAQALGEIKDVRAIEPLILALKDKDDKDTLNLQYRAAEALGQIGAPAVEPLIATLKDEDPHVFFNATKALRIIKDPRAVEPLIAALKDKNREVRFIAAQALGDILDSRAVEPLIAALNDKERDIRWFAAEALGRIRDARAVEPLIEALKDADKGYRQTVAKALKYIGTERALTAIKEIKME